MRAESGGGSETKLIDESVRIRRTGNESTMVQYAQRFGVFFK